MNPDDPWQDPPDALDAPAGVDVWRCPLDREEPDRSDCARLLDPEERARAARFAFDRDRRRWTVARALLRRILGRYAGRLPEELGFDVDAQGKPSLRGVPSISFNLSHSGPLMVVAVAAGRPVGIDVEQIRTEISLAARFLSPRERAALAAAPAALLPVAYFTCWTRKESFVKALGTGLALPLDTIDVGVDPDAQVQVPAAPSLTLRSIPVGPGYASTLAVAGAVEPLRLWRS